MKVFSGVTRQKMSESAKRRVSRPEFLDRVRAYWKPFCSQEELYWLYVTENMSELEIVALFSVTLKRVQTSMKRYGIIPRLAVKRDQIRERNSSWRGADVQYKGAHLRVNRERGSPQYCEKCGTTDPGRSYDWSNMTGKYSDTNDYQRLCRSCHRKKDGASKNFKGANGHRSAPKEVQNAA